MRRSIQYTIMLVRLLYSVMTSHFCSLLPTAYYCDIVRTCEIHHSSHSSDFLAYLMCAEDGGGSFLCCAFLSRREQLASSYRVRVIYLCMLQVLYVTSSSYVCTQIPQQYTRAYCLVERKREAYCTARTRCAQLCHTRANVS